MRKETLLLLTIVLIVQACQLGGSSRVPDATEAFEGKDGLVLSFFENAPPEKVVPESEFNIAILFENKGAVNIECSQNSENCGFFIVSAKEPISSITPSSGKLSDALGETDSLELVGKETYHSGGRAAIEMTATVGDTNRETKSTIIASACYPYKTEISASACVPTAHYTVAEENLACKQKAITLRGQGAPVAVGKIEQDFILSGNSVQPRFKIFVENVGNGVILDKSTEALKTICTAAGEAEDAIGQVTVESATISGQPLNCEGKRFRVAGRSRNDFIECRYTGSDFASGQSNNLVAPLKITLAYGYQTSVSKVVEVEVLDKLPEITEIRVSPKKTETGTEVGIFIAAEDDFGLKEIQLLDENNDEIETNNCEGRLRCEKLFKQTVEGNTKERYEFRAMAIDNSETPSGEGRPSRIRADFGVITGPPVINSFTVPVELEPNTEITITFSVEDDEEVKKAELLDENDEVIDEKICRSGETCSEKFTKTTPSEGRYKYKLRAFDNDGKETVTGEAKPTDEEWQKAEEEAAEAAAAAEEEIAAASEEEQTTTSEQ